MGTRTIQADYTTTLEELEDACLTLREELERFEDAIRRIRHQFDAGGTLGEAMTPALWRARDTVDSAWLDFQHALHRARAEGVAIIIDEDGLSIADFARKRGVSRQLISRLYNEAHLS